MALLLTILTSWNVVKTNTKLLRESGASQNVHNFAVGVRDVSQYFACKSFAFVSTIIILVLLDFI